MDPFDKDTYALRPRQVPIDEVIPWFYNEVEDALFINDVGHLTKKFPGDEQAQIARKQGIQIPVIAEVDQDHPDDTPRFVRPKKYIVESSTSSDAPEYDLDDDDEDLIHAMNEYLAVKGKRAGRKDQATLDDEAFERMIDWLEKETYFKDHPNIPVQLNDGRVELDVKDTPCAVCGSPADSDENQIVFCDRCGLAVHQACYGVEEIPSEDVPWFCQRCESEAPKAVACIFCPNKQGAFKQTADGAWYHILCAAACPSSWTKRSTLPTKPSTASTPKRGSKNQPKTPSKPSAAQNGTSTYEHPEAECHACEKTRGVCITCSEKGCGRIFHATCAVKHGYFVVRTIKSPPTPTPPSPSPSKAKSKKAARLQHLEPSLIKVQAFCRRHCLKPDNVKNRGQLFVPLSLSNRAVDALTNGFLTARHYNLPKVDSDIIEFVFRHWVLKRQLQGHQLIHRLRMNADDVCKSQKRQQKLSKMEGDLKKFVKLRQHLERIRILVDLSKKREILKRQLLDVYPDVLDAIVAEQKKAKAAKEAKTKEAKASSPASTPNPKKRKR